VQINHLNLEFRGNIFKLINIQCSHEVLKRRMGPAVSHLNSWRREICANIGMTVSWPVRLHPEHLHCQQCATSPTSSATSEIHPLETFSKKDDLEDTGRATPL